MCSALAISRPSSSTRGSCTGRTLAGRYVLGGLLGAGERGDVYAALQVDLGREVAVEILSAAAVASEAACNLFLREVRIVAGIHHPGVVEIIDAGTEEDGRPFCVTERLRGETLAECLARRGPLELAEAVTLVTAVSDALQAAYDEGVRHRDVKPRNVFLAMQPDGRVAAKLIHFGIPNRAALAAPIQDPSVRVTTRPGLGKPAPVANDALAEAPRSSSTARLLAATTPSTDVWGLAVALYEIFANVPPFIADELSELLDRILAARPLPVAPRAPQPTLRRLVAPSADAEIERETLCDSPRGPVVPPPRPRDRALTPPSARAEPPVTPALGRLALPPPPEAPPRQPPQRQRRARVIAIACLVAVALVSLAILFRPPARLPAAPVQPPVSVATAPVNAPPVDPSAAATGEPQPAPSSAPTAKVRWTRLPFERPAPSPSAPASARAAASFRIDDIKNPY